MAVLICKACGGSLEPRNGDSIAECSYCGLQQTIPQVEDDFILQMFNQANELRRQFDFDGAKFFLQAITSRYPDEAEAYWQICLCKYGIMYVEDSLTGKQIPTFYRMIPQSILSDADYLNACKYARSNAWKYEEEARKIDNLQKKILQLSSSEDPYDIFICYKKTDANTGMQTEDSRIASQIYMKLIENDYRVFWAERSLPAGCEYEPYIYAALSSAKIMLLLSCDSRHFEATWVKNEWIRYLDMMRTDSDKTILTCYKNISPDDFPARLKALQALDMSDMLFSSDLLERIQKKIPKKKKEMDTEALFHAFQNYQSSAGSKEIALEDGVYSGEAIAGKPHGYGILHTNTGNRYEGNWNAGKRHGQGTIFFSNGDSWEGEWRNGKPWNGSGKYYKQERNNLLCYEGSIIDGVLEGECKIHQNGQILKEGTFLHNKLHGIGSTYIGGKQCSGEFREDYPWNAEGFHPVRDIQPAGTYSGTWVNGLPNGEGTFEIAKSGDTLQGTFQNGLTGTVCWKFSDGRRYEGDIRNGDLNGMGKMYGKNGRLIYEGGYFKGNPHGSGTQYFDDNERYVGQFINGNFHGHGTYYYAQGSWTGEWRDDKRWSGQGHIFYYDENGNRTGKFFNGTLINGVATGLGVLRYEDGSRFHGEFFNDQYYNGTLYNVYNQIVDTYINGESQQEKAQYRNEIIGQTAIGILRGLTGL